MMPRRYSVALLDGNVGVASNVTNCSTIGRVDCAGM